LRWEVRVGLAFWERLELLAVREGADLGDLNILDI
jgi:hypothetical protein